MEWKLYFTIFFFTLLVSENIIIFCNVNQFLGFYYDSLLEFTTYAYYIGSLSLFYRSRQEEYME